MMKLSGIYRPLESDINIPAPILKASASQCVPRAKGNVTVSTKRLGARSVLQDLRQAGSLKLLFPRVATPDLQAVLVNTAGGVTGGDRFAIAATANAGTQLTMTTQAAERAYRAQPGEVGQIRTELTVKADARLVWMPQETILFQGSALDRHLSITMDQSAQLLLCEPLVFGRAAMGETITDASFRDRINITRGGIPLFQDAIHLNGDIAAHLARPTIGNGAGALATLVYIATDAEGHLEDIRNALGPTAGASLVQSDVLLLRILAADSFLLRQTLCPILARLYGGPLPRPWMI